MDPMVKFFKTSLILCGVLLIMSGTVLCLFYAYLAYQLIVSPEDVGVIKYLQSVFLKDYDTSTLIYGTFDGKRVLLKMSEQGQAFGLILLVVLGLGMFSLTSRVLIEGGSAIMRVFTSPFFHEYGRKMKLAQAQKILQDHKRQQQLQEQMRNSRQQVSAAQAQNSQQPQTSQVLQEEVDDTGVVNHSDPRNRR